MSKLPLAIRDILSPECILLNQEVRSKKKALELFAQLFSQQNSNLHQDSILEALSAREKLGSTALEKGIALPHCRISGCQKPTSGIITLTKGIDFDTRDGEPVSLLWALIVPEQATEEHLDILASIASILNNTTLRHHINNTQDSATLYAQLTE